MTAALATVSLQCKAQASILTLWYWLCRVLDDSGHQCQTSPSCKGCWDRVHHCLGHHSAVCIWLEYETMSLDKNNLCAIVHVRTEQQSRPWQTVNDATLSSKLLLDQRHDLIVDAGLLLHFQLILEVWSIKTLHKPNSTVFVSLSGIRHIKHNQNQQHLPSLNFYRPDALPDAQTTVSKHWRKKPHNTQFLINACEESSTVRKEWR